MAHLSERSLQAYQQNLLGGIKDVKLPFNDHYLMEKYTRVKLGEGKHSTKGILDFFKEGVDASTKIEGWSFWKTHQKKEVGWEANK